MSNEVFNLCQRLSGFFPDVTQCTKIRKKVQFGVTCSTTDSLNQWLTSTFFLFYFIFFRMRSSPRIILQRKEEKSSKNMILAFEVKSFNYSLIKKMTLASLSIPLSLAYNITRSFLVIRCW